MKEFLRDSLKGSVEFYNDMVELIANFLNRKASELEQYGREPVHWELVAGLFTLSLVLLAIIASVIFTVSWLLGR